MDEQPGGRGRQFRAGTSRDLAEAQRGFSANFRIGIVCCALEKGHGRGPHCLKLAQCPAAFLEAPAAQLLHEELDPLTILIGQRQLAEVGQQSRAIGGDAGGLELTFISEAGIVRSCGTTAGEHGQEGRQAGQDEALAADHTGNSARNSRRANLL